MKAPAKAKKKLLPSNWLSSTNAPISVASFFSGCGGLDIGAQLAGCDVVFGNDRSKDSAKSFESYFLKAQVVNSPIERLVDFPTADVVTGGYPCQSFSMGGNRSPADDNRSLLYKQFVRAIKVIEPKIFVAENVVGLLSLDEGRHFRSQLRALAGAGPGYRVTTARMDCHKYGIPQKRARVIIVGVRRDVGMKFTFPEPTHGDGLLPYTSHGEIVSGMPLWPEGEFYQRNGGDEDNFPWYYMSRNRKAAWDSPSYTIVANWRHTPLHPASPAMKLTWSNLSDGSKQRWDFTGEYEHLIGNPDRFHLERPRRLSWRECAAIQGFPANFEPAGTVQSKFTQIGNAVPPTLSKLIFDRIVKQIGFISV